MRTCKADTVSYVHINQFFLGFVFILLVLALAREGKLVLRLAVRDLVDTEPLISGTKKTRQVALNILDIVELGSKWVVDVNDNDLPVGFFFIQQSHHTKNLDLLNLTWVANQFSNFANIERVIVTLSLGLRMDSVGVFIGL